MGKSKPQLNLGGIALGRNACAGLLVAGIVLIGMWGNLLGYSKLLFPVVDSSQAALLGSWYTWGRLTVAVLFIVAAAGLRRHAGIVGLISGVAMMPATLLICLAASMHPGAVESALLSPSLLLQANAFLAGIGFLAVSVPLFIELAHLVEPRCAAALAMAGIVGECLASTALSACANFDAQLLACLLAPPLAGACLFAVNRFASTNAEDERFAGTGAKPPQRFANRRATTGALAALARRDAFGSAIMVAQLAVAMVLASSLRFLSDMGPWGYAHEGYLAQAALSPALLLITCLVVVAATLLAYVLPKRLPSQMRCAIALVIVLAGVQLASAAPGGHAGQLMAAAVVGCQLFSRVIIWVTFMDCVRQLRAEPLRVNGATCLFNVAATLLCSAALGAGLQPAILSTSLVVVLLFLAVAAIAIPFTSRAHDPQIADDQPCEKPAAQPATSARSDAESPAQPASPAQQAPQEAAAASPSSRPEAPRNAKSSSAATPEAEAAAPSRLHAFASAYGVSPREEQVLGLLLDGCTRGQIERLLGLSEGTVRTHVNAVYRKLDVHSKAQAHERYDSWGEE